MRTALQKIFRLRPEEFIGLPLDAWWQRQRERAERETAPRPSVTRAGPLSRA